MTRSIFGWSYPPGCSGPPDEPEMPCALCGNSTDNCTCPECQHPVPAYGGGEEPCTVQGCIEHLPSNQLRSKIELLQYQVSELEAEAKKRETKTPPCPVCGEEQTITIFTEEIYCHGHFYYGKNGWVKDENEDIAWAIALRRKEAGQG